MQGPRIPSGAEHGRNQIGQGRFRLQPLDQVTNITFEIIPPDGFTVGLASFCLAQVVRVSLAIAAFRERRPQRRITEGAHSDTTQSEVIADISAFRCASTTRQTILDFLKGFERDQRHMLHLMPGQPVGLAVKVPSVDRLAYHLGDKLRPNAPGFVTREPRISLQEPSHFRLCLETPIGKAFQRLLYNRGGRLVTHQRFPLPCDLLKAIACRWQMTPEPQISTHIHLLFNLTPVLFALQRPLCRNDGFHKLGLRRVTKTEVRAFYGYAAQTEGIAEIKERSRVSAQPFEVVEDTDELLPRLRVDEGQESDHAGAFHKVTTASDRIREHSFHIVVARYGVLTAPGLLTIKAMPVRFLGL